MKIVIPAQNTFHSTAAQSSASQNTYADTHPLRQIVSSNHSHQLSGPLFGYLSSTMTHYFVLIVIFLICIWRFVCSIMLCVIVVIASHLGVFGFIIIGFQVMLFAGRSFILIHSPIILNLRFGSGIMIVLMLILLVVTTFVTGPMSASLQM